MQRSSGPKGTIEVICNINLCLLLLRNTINRTYPKHINIQPRHLQYFIWLEYAETPLTVGVAIVWQYPILFHSHCREKYIKTFLTETKGNLYRSGYLDMDRYCHTILRTFGFEFLQDYGSFEKLY